MLAIGVALRAAVLAVARYSCAMVSLWPRVQEYRKQVQNRLHTAVALFLAGVGFQYVAFCSEFVCLSAACQKAMGSSRAPMFAAELLHSHGAKMSHGAKKSSFAI